MKNYKHAVKSASAMKLAAVASSAIMLAPVAMNTVSSLAAGVATNGVAYPVYTPIAVPSAGLSNTSLDGISDYLNVNNQAIQDAIDAILGMATPKAESLKANQKSAQDNATAALAKVITDRSSIFNQMGLEQRNKFADKASQIKNVLAEIITTNENALANYNKLNNQLTNAQAKLEKRYNGADMFFNNESYLKKADNGVWKALSESGVDFSTITFVQYKWAVNIAHPGKDAKLMQDKAQGQYTAEQKMTVDRLAKEVKTATNDLKSAIKAYNSFTDALSKLGQEMLNATANGTVDSAARAALATITRMPNNKVRANAVKQYNSIVSTYAETTKLGAKTPGNPEKIEAAANVAVIALHKLANKTIDDGAGKQLGVATVNYNPNYGIQIWTKNGLPVRFDAKDAKAWNELHPEKQVKVGDAKKLAGQTSWKVFKNTYTAHGTTYYNLGGDQYIDANYVTVNF